MTNNNELTLTAILTAIAHRALELDPYFTDTTDLFDSLDSNNLDPILRPLFDALRATADALDIPDRAELELDFDEILDTLR